MFQYTGPNVNGLPHLGSVISEIGTAENYTISYYTTPTTIADPFGAGKSYTSDALLKTVSSGVPLSTTFFYNASGEMTMAQLPYGGYQRWSYQSLSYPMTGAKQMTVTGRYLAQDSGASNTSGTAETPCGAAPCENSFPITFTAPSSSQPVVPYSCVSDPTGSASCWYFNALTQYEWALGLPIKVQRKASASATTFITDDWLTWEQESAQWNTYLAIDTKYRDATLATETNGTAMASQTNQTIGQYGNVLETDEWDYTVGAFSATPTRKYVSSYVTDATHVGAYIRNLLSQTQLTAGGTTYKLVTNTYDSYGSGITSVTGLNEHDDAKYPASFTNRGNVTSSAGLVTTVATTYDMTGTVTGSSDGNGHAVSVSTSSANNYSAPTQIQPSTGQSSDASLGTSYAYNGFLGVTSASGPNSSQASYTYDSIGRPLTSTIPAGAQTNYIYTFGATNTTGPVAGNGPYTITATTGTHWIKTVLDGLGRAIAQQSGYNSGTPPTASAISEVDTVYGPAASSPMGAALKVSQPYSLGGSEYWTVTNYDALGRITSKVLPDGASTSTSVYQQNWTTATDPNSKWKQYQSDAFGNLVQVVEPDPTYTPNPPGPPSPPNAPSPPNPSAAGMLATTYTYDPVNHLLTVQMKRGAVTQNRSFTYNSKFQLASTTSPEATGGSTSYTYNADGTLATRTDPKGQVTSYFYDLYQRLTKVTHGSDVTQTVTYSYDSSSLDPNHTYALGDWGKLTGVTGGTGTHTYTEAYAYTTAGQMAIKQLNVGSSPAITGSFAYDQEGKLASITYPGGTSQTALTVNYSYDAMSRLVGAGAVNQPFSPTGCSAFNGGVTLAQNGAYNAAGQLVGLERLSYSTAFCPSTVQPYYYNQAWQYNALNQLTEIDTSTQSSGYPSGSVNPGLATSFFVKYAYSATANNGQITQATDARLGYSINYGYDALKRLTSAASTGPWSQNFSYDGFGNLTAKNAPANSSEPSFPGVNSANNQLNGLIYDGNGNVTDFNAFTLNYDMENRLASSTSSSLTETNVFDESNRRIEQTLSDGSPSVVYFYGPGGQVLSVMQAQPFVPWDVSTKYNNVYFGSMLLGPAGGSTISDRLGTVNPGYPYGTDIGTQALQSNPGMLDFATYSNDSITGLEYANQRWYTAGYGRFLTPDRSGRNVDPTNSITWNHFAYANGDPVGKSDPSGTCAEGDASCNACPEGDPGCSCPDQTCLCDPTDPTSPCYQRACAAAANGFEPNPEAIAGPGCGGPPPPPQTAPDTCDVSLYAQSAGPSWDPFVHTDLLLTDDDPNTNVSQSAYLESGPLVFNSKGNWAFQVFFGHSWNNEFFHPDLLYKNNQNLVYNFASSYSSSQLCTAINVLGGEYSAYKNFATIYHPVYGPNSNSFAGTFLRGANLSLPLLIEAAVELYAVGWTAPLGQL